MPAQPVKVLTQATTNGYDLVTAVDDKEVTLRIARNGHNHGIAKLLDADVSRLINALTTARMGMVP